MNNKNKNMKNLLMACSATILMGGFSSCVDMDLTPKNAPSENSVWSSATMAEQTVAGVYNRLYDDYQGTSDKGWFDMWTYMMDIDANWVGWYQFLTGANSSSTDWGSERYWKNYYGSIIRANDVIGNLPNVQGLDEAKKSRYISEVTFLRSWWYYRLNILYDGVPYYTEPIKNPDEANLPRSTQDEIWDYLIADLTSCIENPNLPDKYASSDSDYGHITKGACYALRGKIYMWKQDWQKAIDDFKAVGNCGYSLYTGSGAESYKQLFKLANERCDEMIFSIQCVDEDAYAHRKPQGFGNRVTAGSDWNNYLPNPAFVDSYECVDGKPFNWNDFIPGYNEMSTNARMVYFLRDGMTEKERSDMAAAGADLSKYLETGNEARIRAAYENRDPRLQMSIITPYSTYLGGIAGFAQDYTMRFPYRGSDTGEPWDLRTDTNSKMYYLNRKFVPEGMEFVTMYSEVDLPQIRYADVLLSLAEALNELNGPTSEAIECVNQVRRRAGVAELNSNEYTQVTSQENLRERIMNEKHWELVGEDQVLFDEMRWRTWKDLKFYTDSHGQKNGLRQVWGTPTYTYTWGGDQYWSLPIPIREIQMNPNMQQTPGWE